MVVLSGEIKIGNLTFKQFNEVKITKSVDLISDTATIILPTKFTLRQTGEKFQTEKAIKVGDKVEIILRYEGTKARGLNPLSNPLLEKKEFVGYVTKIKPNTPVEIECEDVVYWLRKKSLNKMLINTSLKEVMEFITKEIKVQNEVINLSLSGEIPDMKLDKFLLKDVNGAQALEKIKTDYGLSIYLDDNGKLFAGFQQTNNALQVVKYDFNKNMIAQNLEFQRAEDVKLKVKCVGFKKDNSKIEVEVGDSDGELKTYHYQNISSAEELKKIGENELKKFKVDGYKGSLTSFFMPFATRGMSVELTDKNYPKRQGRYFIPKVEVEFGTNGGRRIVTLANKLTDKL